MTRTAPATPCGSFCGLMAPWWRQGSSGRLGLGDELNIAVPTMVESLQGLGIEGIKCFAEHTMALTVPMEARN